MQKGPTQYCAPTICKANSSLFIWDFTFYSSKEHKQNICSPAAVFSSTSLHWLCHRGLQRIKADIFVKKCFSTFCFICFHECCRSVNAMLLKSPRPLCRWGRPGAFPPPRSLPAPLPAWHLPGAGTLLLPALHGQLRTVCRCPHLCQVQGWLQALWGHLPGCPLQSGWVCLGTWRALQSTFSQITFSTNGFLVAKIHKTGELVIDSLFSQK